MSDNKEQGGQTSGRPPFVIPALRVFMVRRYRPGHCPENEDCIEELQLAAHVVQHNDSGQVLMFLDYVIDPITGPMMQLRRMINGYIEMTEVALARESSFIYQ